MATYSSSRRTTSSRSGAKRAGAATGGGFYASYRRPNGEKKRQPTPTVPKPVEKPQPAPVPEEAPKPVIAEPVPAPVKKKAPRIKSLRKPKPLKRAPRKTRPSLSEQLANIGSGAASVTADLRKKHNLHPGEGEPLFTSPSLKFIVGRLESKLPSPVNFFHDHCGYIFNHPYQSKQIKMKMYYSDMQKAHVRESMGNYVFEFKIGHAMKQYGIDYDPGQHDHMVKIVLASQRDAKMIKEKILKRR